MQECAKLYIYLWSCFILSSLYCFNLNLDTQEIEFMNKHIVSKGICVWYNYITLMMMIIIISMFINISKNKNNHSDSSGNNNRNCYNYNNNSNSKRLSFVFISNQSILLLIFSNYFSHTEKTNQHTTAVQNNNKEKSQTIMKKTFKYRKSV